MPDCADTHAGSNVCSIQSGQENLYIASFLIHEGNSYNGTEKQQTVGTFKNAVEFCDPRSENRFLAESFHFWQRPDGKNDLI